MIPDKKGLQSEIEYNAPSFGEDVKMRLCYAKMRIEILKNNPQTKENVYE
jgi:hypothetical protein